MLVFVARWLLVGLVCAAVGFGGGWLLHGGSKTGPVTVVVSTQDPCQGLASKDYSFC